MVCIKDIKELLESKRVGRYGPVMSELPGLPFTCRIN